jgi:BASS family bile acid:Na+ symporter
MMLAVGLAVDGGELVGVVRQRTLILSTLAAHWVAMPQVAVAIAFGLRLEASLTAALLVLAACPVGDIVNFYALVGRGNVSLAVAINALSCLLAPLGMAAVFYAYRMVLPGDSPLSVPGWGLVARLFLFAIIPIALGMLARARRPDWARRWLAPCSRLAGAGILAVLGWAMVRQGNHLLSIWATAVPAVLAFLAVGLLVGAGWTLVHRLSRADALAVGVTFPVRNTGLAAALATTLLGRPDFLSLFALYFFLEVPVFLLGTRLWRSARAAD